MTAGFGLCLGADEVEVETEVEMDSPTKASPF